MAIALSGQNIVISGSGNHTWAEVVALGSTDMVVAASAVAGKTLYRWSGIITVSGSCVLDIHDELIELLEKSSTPGTGQIRSIGTGIVNIGRKRTINSQAYYDKACTIIISRRRYTANKGQTQEVQIASLSCNPEDNSQVNVYGSTIIFSNPENISDSSKRIPIYTFKLENSTIYSPSRGSVDGPMFFSISDPGLNRFTNVDYTKVGSGRVSDLEFYNSSITVYLESPTRMILNRCIQNLETPLIPTIISFYLNQIDIVNATDFNFSSNSTVYKSGDSAPAEWRKIYTHNISAKNSDGSPAQGVLCSYSGRTNISQVSDSSGNFPTFELSGLETNFAGYSPQPDAYETYALPIPTINYSNYSREIRSYLHSPLVEALTVDSQIGSPATPLTIRLNTDSGISQTNTTTVNGYSGITNTSTTITVSGTLTLDQLYDSRKLYWRVNGGLCPSINVNVAVLGGLNLVVTGSISATTKFIGGVSLSGNVTLQNSTSINFPVSSTGTITLQSAGNYSSLKSEIAATGIVVVSPGVTDLRGWTFAADATINVSSGNAIVTVDSIVGITAGTNVTIKSGQITFTGFPTVNNTLGLAPSSTLAILDVASGNWTTYDASSGSVAVFLSDIATGATINYRADAIGWYRTPDVNVTVATAPATIDVTNLFKEVLDESGNPICGTGDTAEMVRISYNQGAGRFEFDGGQITFASLVQQFEILSSSQAGLITFSSLIREVVFTKNAYAQSVSIPTPLTISATSAASTSPIFTNFIVSRTGDPGADVFVHGLASTAAGLTDRPEVRQQQVQFITASNGATVGEVQEIVKRETGNVIGSLI